MVQQWEGSDEGGQSPEGAEKRTEGFQEGIIQMKRHERHGLLSQIVLQCTRNDMHINSIQLNLIHITIERVMQLQHIFAVSGETEQPLLIQI